ncbi:MAG: DUF2079 domain-containing protein [Thermodesulfobacteriota bacterium]|nr:DUF2079 domain-containing protein [Thermodesulfobacteriota bacterium]
MLLKVNFQKLIKITADIIMLLCVVAMAISLSGGFQIEIFGFIHLSIHKFLQPLSILFAVFFLRLWITSPSGLGIVGKLDFWLERAGQFVCFVSFSDRGQPRKYVYLFFKWTGLRIPDTDLQWNGSRFSAVVTILMIFILTGMPTYRFLNCGSADDLTVFVDAMNSAIKGGLFENCAHFHQFNTIDEIISSNHPKLSSFAAHFRPILFLLIPFYWLAPHAITLFLVQAIIIAGSIRPFYNLANAFLQRKDWAFAITTCYCLYPSIISTSNSFFPGTFSITFLMWAFWLLWQKRYLLMALCLFLTLSCKEVMALPVISFGAYVFFFNRKRIIGTTIIVASLFWLFASINLIIPSFMPAGSYAWTGLYKNFGSSLPQIIQTILLHPYKLIPYIFSLTTWKYLFRLLFPVAFLPARAWRIWLLALPVLAQNILAGDPGMIRYRHSAGLWSASIVPFTFIAVLWALRFMKKNHNELFLKRVLAVVVITSLLSLGNASVRNWKNQSEINQILYFHKIAPHGAVVSTNIGMFWCHLTKKYDLRIFPNSWDNSDYVVVKHKDSRFRGKNYAPDKNFAYLVRLKNDRRFSKIWNEYNKNLRTTYIIYKRKTGVP